MSDDISHTIRFEKQKKAEIKAISKKERRTFQSQVEYMLDMQLRDQDVVRFLRRVRCVLDSVDPDERADLMAKIATLTGLEL